MALRSNFTNQFLSDALPVLEALIWDEIGKYPDVVPDVFNVKSLDQWGVQDLVMAGLGAAQETNEGEEVSWDATAEGFSKTYQPVEYTLAVNFSKTVIEDNRLNLVEETYRELGMAMFQTKQIVSMNVLNNAFTTTGPDGAVMCATSHTMIGGHTYGNRPSTDIALSMAGLREMVTIFGRQVNHRNLNVQLVPSKLIVPPELAQTAFELTKSDMRLDTPNNAANFYSGKYTVIVSPYLTSTTAWWMQAQKHYLKFINRISPESDSWYDNATRTANTSTRCRFDVGYTDYIGMTGTTG